MGKDHASWAYCWPTHDFVCVLVSLPDQRTCGKVIRLLLNYYVYCALYHLYIESLLTFWYTHRANCSIVWGEWLAISSNPRSETTWKSININCLFFFSSEDSPWCGSWKRLCWDSRTLQRNRGKYMWWYYQKNILPGSTADLNWVSLILRPTVWWCCTDCLGNCIKNLYTYSF